MYLQIRPMFDALRADPRYPELLRRMNLTEVVDHLMEGVRKAGLAVDGLL